MKKWIDTSLIEPADLKGQTVSGRFGGSVMFVAYSRISGWHWVCPQSMEAIAEPPELLLEPDWAKAHPRKSPLVERGKPRIRKRKSEQLTLGL